MKDWNDAHRAGHSARENADAAWAKKQEQDEVEAGAVGHGVAWTKPKIGEDPRKPSRIKLVPFEQRRLGTERPYLVKGLIPRTGLTVIWGPPKSGKSFWTFDLSMHVALVWDYRGLRVQQGAVVYCAFEGQSGIKKRVEAFRLRHLAEDARRAPFYLQAGILDLVKDYRELIAAISLALGDTKPTAVDARCPSGGRTVAVRAVDMPGLLRPAPPPERLAGRSLRPTTGISRAGESPDWRPAGGRGIDHDSWRPGVAGDVEGVEHMAGHGTAGGEAVLVREPVVDAGVDAGKAGLLAQIPPLGRLLWEHGAHQFRHRAGNDRRVRDVGGMIRHRDQRHDQPLSHARAF